MAEDGKDPFAGLIKFCKPTESQEAMLRNCPFARDSENVTDANPPSQFSSMTQTDAGDIVVVTAPGSSSSGDKPILEEDSVFHTPPEHHSHSHLSSSGDQNPNEAGSDDRRRNFRAPGDEPESKRVRVVAGDKYDSDTVPLCETVPLGETEVVGIEEDESDNTEVVVLSDSDGEERAKGGGEEVVGLVKDGVEHAEEIGVPRGENLDSSGSLERKAVECQEMPKDSSHGDDGGKRVTELRNADGRCEGRGRRLPPSLEGASNDVVESAGEKVGLLGMMDKLRAIFGYPDDGEHVDFLETAKKKGMTFPKPRWQHDS